MTSGQEMERVNSYDPGARTGLVMRKYTKLKSFVKRVNVGSKMKSRARVATSRRFNSRLPQRCAATLGKSFTHACPASEVTTVWRYSNL